jgi:AcrR family transcriptional regulator
MSSNARCPEKQKADRRVLRTRDRLGDALVELVQEKAFDAITVQDVLDRAGVARSTFYNHYRDTDDLFLSDVDEFLEKMAMRLVRGGEASERVAPVREFFAHVASSRALWDALAAAGRMPDFMELARGHFARAIEQRLAQMPQPAGSAAAERSALAHAHAGALLSLLTWWMQRGAQQPAVEMDELFHRAVWGRAAMR